VRSIEVILAGLLLLASCETFEVASIKLNTTGLGGGYPELAPGGRRFTATNQHMLELIMFAYDVSPRQILGIPAAFREGKYDIEATCEHPMTKEQLPGMMQSLLGHRFRLSIHRETREQPVYALVQGKSIPKLREAPPDAGKTSFRQSGYNFTFTNAATSDLVGVLSQVTGRKVLDKTGLSGRYDFTLRYAPDRDGGSTGDDRLPESVFTAIREQLGLNLEAQTGQVEFVVVDRLERLIPN
jgi:uncharacterized protein (TIGR03435 family)